MDASPFSAALASWHDFYLAVASASAALLGLLFVGVSINLSVIGAAERVGLRTRAEVAFSNLLYLLGLSLIMLVPTFDAGALAINFTAVAALGLLRLARRARGLLRAHAALRRDVLTLRRMAWTLAADLLLLAVASQLASTGDGRWLEAMPIVVFVLLIGAADVAWGMLVLEARDRA